MLKLFLKSFSTFEVSFYSYHRFIHNFDFHTDHHESKSNKELLYSDKPNYSNTDLVDKHLLGGGVILSGITYSSLGYISKNMKCVLVYWSIGALIHPILHKYELKYWPLSYIQERHRLHHENPNIKFGPVTPFMDIIFGTENSKIRVEECGAPPTRR